MTHHLGGALCSTKEISRTRPKMAIIEMDTTEVVPIIIAILLLAADAEFAQQVLVPA